MPVRWSETLTGPFLDVLFAAAVQLSLLLARLLVIWAPGVLADDHRWGFP